MPTLTPSPVTGIAAADPAAALDHFERLLAFETDCWDVHAALAAGQQDFVLLDVHSPEAYQQGHVPGAVNLPHRQIVGRALSDFPEDALFVVYSEGRIATVPTARPSNCRVLGARRRRCWAAFTSGTWKGS
jgi:hypothetical protein